MKKKFETVGILLILTVLIGFGTTAHAVVGRFPLAAFSPTLNPFGMPSWYQGANGMQLGLCLDRPIYDITLDPTCAPIQDPCLLDPGMVPNAGGTACVPAPGAVFDPRLPLALPGNFPDESFYYMGDAIIDNAGPNGNLRMIVLQHLEVAFLGLVIPGGHIIFSRIQVDSGTTAGPNTLKLEPNSTYTFTFPMGEIVGTTDAAGVLLSEGGSPTGRIRHEMGDAAPPSNPALAMTLDPFQPATTNIIGPNFLGAAALGFPGPIPGYTGLFLGNPNLGDQPIQPGINGNFFRVTGPNVGGPGINTIQTLAFSIMGKQFAPAVVVKKWLVDFDGNGSTDMTVFRDGAWFVRPSSGAAPFGVAWGNATDVVAPGDYDGDNKTDLAVYRNGSWFIIPSATPAAPFGKIWGGDATDKPVQGDYDGDGKTDLAVYRAVNGFWFVAPSSGAIPFAVIWGGNPADKPVPADYDGDGKLDQAVYRAGTWFIKPSSPNAPFGTIWGGDATDIPVPGDYDGDGKADLAVYRAGSGAWFVKPSLAGNPPFGVAWGGDATDIPVPGDYDGDGKADLAVYRAASGAWFVKPSLAGNPPFGVAWGGDATDKPVPGDYDNDGKADLAVYRAASGAWFVRPSSGAAPFGVAWGGDATDKPVTLLVP